MQKFHINTHHAKLVFLFLSAPVLIILSAGCLTGMRSAVGNNYTSANTSTAGRDSIDWESLSAGADVRAFIPTGHSNIVWDIVYSPDGRYIAAGSIEIKLWDTETGTLIRTFPGGYRRRSLDFSPNGEFLLSVSEQNKGLQIWRTASGEHHFTLQDENSAFSSAAFSPDGTMIAGGSYEHITIWNTSTHEIITRLKGFRYAIKKVVFSPYGKTLISAGEDDYIRIWDTETWEQIGDIPADHLNDIPDLAVSPDGRYIAGGVGASASLWKTNSGKLVKEMKDGNEDLRSLRFSPDGKHLATTQADNVIKIWAVPTGNLVTRLDLPRALSSDGYSLAFSPDGTSLACGQFKRISTWNMQTMSPGRILENKTESSGWSSDSVVYHQETGQLFLSAEDEMQVWNLFSNSIRTWDGESFRDITTYALSPDGKVIALTNRDHALILIDSTTGSLLRRFEVSVNATYPPVFSTSGKYLAVIAEDSHHVLLLDSRTGEVLHSFDTGKASISHFGFNQNDTILYGGSNYYWEDGSYSWDIRTGRQMKHIPIQYLGSSSRNGDTLLRISKDSLEIHDSSLNDRKGMLTIPDDGYLQTSFSPGGSYLAVAGESSIQVWDLSTMTPLKGIQDSNFKDRITYCSFITDSHLITMYDDWFGNGTIRFINVEDGSRLDLMSSKSENWEKQAGEWQRSYTANWFVSDNIGRFDTGSDAFKRVKFVRGMETYDARQFWDNYYTPGLIASFLGLSQNTTPPVKIAEAFNNVPIVSISSQTPADQKDVLRVTVTAKPRDNGVGELFLLHNGRRIDEKNRGLEIVSDTGDTRTFLIPLIEGNNELQGGAYDRDHTVYGTSDVLHISYEPPRVTPPNMYILAVGVGNYRDTALNLTFPDEDAEAVAGLFQDRARGLYRTVQTNILKNGAADRQHIIDGLDLFMKKAESRDAVILFFAGHGYVEDGIYYFLPSDTDITDLESSAISISILEDFLREIPANKIAVFLDTCQSGSAVKSLGTVAMSRSVEERRLIANLAKARGIAVFSASSAAQSAYEIPELHHGIFTYGILNAFGNRVEQISEDGRISLGKLLSTVNGITRETAYRYLKIEQSPAVYQFGDDFQIGQVQ